MAETVHMTLDEAHDLALRALTHNGLSREQSRAIADTVTAAERDECTSHGLFRIPFYVSALGDEQVNPNAVPVLSDAANAVAHVDAGHGFAPLALERGAPALVEKARANGIAALSVNNAYHIAALWPELERIAEQGLVAFAFVAAMPYVAPAGGTRALYGTNPMGFAWPRSGRPPLVFDQASSVSARGEIQLHLREGRPLPEGWAIGPDGLPTTDPQTALDGAQLTFGGYKGAAIALMVELLAGALVGDVFSFEAKERGGASGAPCGGEFMMAVDPGRCAPGASAGAAMEHAEGLFARILEQEGTRLPSDRRFAARERTPVEGIQVNAPLVTRLRDLAG
jgi:LDH2 family malate/lactate/ureidoglycolate dehydrogenase